MVHSTVKIGPDWFDLHNTEQEWMHETKDVKCHLFGREGADSIAF